jgi:hypothetical protein
VTDQHRLAPAEEHSAVGALIYNPWIFYAYGTIPPNGRSSAGTSFRGAREGHVPSSGPDDRSVRRGAWLSYVPQSGALVFQTLWPANVFNKRVVTIANRSEFQKILQEYVAWREQFLDENGDLKSNYRRVR